MWHSSKIVHTHTELCADAKKRIRCEAFSNCRRNYHSAERMGRSIQKILLDKSWDFTANPTQNTRIDSVKVANIIGQFTGWWNEKS